MTVTTGAETVIVYLSTDGHLRTLDLLTEDDFANPAGFHYVPRAIWNEWLRAQQQWNRAHQRWTAARKALENTPSATLTQLRRAILDGYGR